MAIERTFIILKPDAVNRGICGEVIARFEKKGLKIVAMKMAKLSEDVLKEHYAHHSGKPFFPDLIEFMSKSPVILGVVEGRNAVGLVRQMCGVTDANKAAPGTIRGDFALSTSRNVIHASDSTDTAKNEIEKFFRPDEIFDYELNNKQYLYAADEV